MKLAIVPALFPVYATSAAVGPVPYGAPRLRRLGAPQRSRAIRGFCAGVAVPAATKRLYGMAFKRALDLCLLLIAAPVVVPIVLVLALLVAREGGAPFYTQLRVGKNGRPFRMLKLRTMVVDADARLAAHLAANPEARAEWDRNQKLRQDPRITRFGQFLRKSSLDELPQLWNVLMGDMSIVGPRPMMVAQKPMYPGRAYRLVRPGLTGLWQTTDRNQSSFAARADFDATYVDRLSFSADLRIIFKTVQVVVKGTGC